MNIYKKCLKRGEKIANKMVMLNAGVGITPLISNLLKGKVLTIQEAYQPTIEFYTIVHNL